MRFIRHTFLFFGLVIGFGFSLCAHAETLDLQQCLERAFEQSERIRIEVAGVKAAVAIAKEAGADLLPQLNANVTYTYSPLLGTSVFDIDVPEGTDVDELGLPEEPIEVEFGAPHNGVAGVTLQQPLFTWGRLRNGVAQAVASVQAAQQELEVVRQQLQLEVTEAFYGVMFTQELVTVTQRALEQTKKHQALAKSRVETGVTTKFDQLRAEVELANATTAHIQTKNNMELAKENLKLLLNMPINTPIEVVGIFDTDSAELVLAPLLEEATQKRPELQQLRFQEIAGEKAVRVAKSGNKPDLGLTSNYQYQRNNRQSLGTHSVNVAVMLNLPIFDGFRTKARVEGAKMRLEQTQLGREHLEDVVRLEVKSAYLNLRQARSLIQAQQETVVQATESLRIANLQYGNGMITNVELTDTELALTQAEVNQIQAFHGYVIARARLERAIGRPL